MTFLWLALDYIVTPLGMILGSLVCGLWWRWDKNPNISIYIYIFLLLTLYAYVYETGYKKYLKQRELRGYYYLIFVIPVFLATVSFIYGVLKYVLYWI